MNAREILHGQLLHWRRAIQSLGRLEDVAPVRVWRDLESDVGLPLRDTLANSVYRLLEQTNGMLAAIRAAPLDRLQEGVQQVRRRFLRTELMQDFYADALRSRVSDDASAFLNGCGTLAVRSLQPILQRAGLPVPPVLVYQSNGLGASVLKNDLRLWDGSRNPVAAIKIVNHNKARTALLHESGHVCMHMTGANDQIAARLRSDLPSVVGSVLADNAAEIAADAHAFLHAGFGSVAALHDVIDGGEARVFAFLPGAPHPIPWVRLLLNVGFCRALLGEQGPWADLSQAWLERYPTAAAPVDIRGLLDAMHKHVPDIARLVLLTRYPSFGGSRLVDLIDPQRVHPQRLEQQPELWGDNELGFVRMGSADPIGTLATTTYLGATRPDASDRYTQFQEAAIRGLGRLRVAA